MSKPADQDQSVPSKEDETVEMMKELRAAARQAIKFASQALSIVPSPEHLLSNGPKSVVTRLGLRALDQGRRAAQTVALYETESWEKLWERGSWQQGTDSPEIADEGWWNPKEGD